MSAFEAITGLASILGFVFSLLAFVQARRASNAARQARDGILIRTLADEFELACVKLDRLLDLLLHDHVVEAAMVAHELTSALSEIPSRKSRYLDGARKDELLNLRAQMQIVEQEIFAVRGQPLVQKKKQNLIQVCQKTSVTLRENLGTIKKDLDLGGKQ